MKWTHPGADSPERQAEQRLIPQSWLKRAAGPSRRPQHRADSESRKWLTTFAAPLADVRQAALQALAAMEAEIAYLYEADSKIVIRATQPHLQIRAELVRLEPASTRAVVACMHDNEVDRLTSSRVIRAMEEILERVT